MTTSLQDVVQQETYTLKDALAQLAHRLHNAETKRRAAEQRKGRLASAVTTRRKEANEAKQVAEAREREIQGINSDLDDLAQQRSALLSRLDEASTAHREAQYALAEAQHKEREAKQEVESDKTEEERTGREYEELRQEERQYQVQLREAHDRSLAGYLELLDQRVQQAVDGKGHAAKLRALRKARSQDVGIADLYDTRDELKRLTSEAKVPSVRQLIQAQLAGVEEQLDQRFPGALLAEGRVEAASSVEGIYHFTDRAGHLTILLPVSSRTWRELESGSTSTASEAAVILVGAIAKHLRLPPAAVSFTEKAGFWPLSARDATGLLSGNATVSVPLRDGDDLALVLTPLSEEIARALGL